MGYGLGAAYLILGSSAPASAYPSTAVQYTGESVADIAGGSVSDAGDVDGDGFDDLLVGAYGNSDSALDAGASYLILSSASPASSGLSGEVQYSGEAAGDHAGHAVSSAGDVNGDGRPDMIIGTAEQDDVGDDAGAAYLIFGTGR
ncbi:MAG: hypothetical protein EXR69_01410 [Myxococcales bacterium]|nr:hypothetical protein [Myxococcales bacterium]